MKWNELAFDVRKKEADGNVRLDIGVLIDGEGKPAEILTPSNGKGSGGGNSAAAAKPKGKPSGALNLEGRGAAGILGA